jgi:hypothetical protein
VKKESTKNDKLVTYPSAVDYFVVNEDAATSRQAFESFHEVYGDEPRELRVTFPAPLVDDVLEGAWRSYGTGGKLKRRCEGPGGECMERGEDGEWMYGPCACAREGLDPKDKRKHWNAYAHADADGRARRRVAGGRRHTLTAEAWRAPCADGETVATCRKRGDARCRWLTRASRRRFHSLGSGRRSSAQALEMGGAPA